MKKTNQRPIYNVQGYSFFAVIGVAWAAVVSWSITPSIGWTIFHAFFGWFYLILHWLGIHTN